MTMPSYTYECKDDALSKEYLLSMTHEPPACDLCGKPMNRVFDAVPIHFKGSGFYTTGG